jgi:DNA-binding CsgD family transcriptional regulator/tetratricopeptide (TPR) repeat protein
MGQADASLLERGEAIDWLASAFAEARRSGLLVAVTGEAGIGKTSLLRQFADTHQHDADVRWGVCDPLATQRPLAPLVDIAAGAAWLELLEQPAGRALVFDALLRDLTVSGRTPIVVVEDVHWADDATLDLLIFLRRRVATTKALLVISYRDDELGSSHPLRQVMGEIVSSASRRLRLQPLTAVAVAHMASGAAVDPVELYRVTTGNPFFVTETLAEPSAEVAMTVRDAVMARARHLGAEARRALEVVAITPGGVEIALVERLSGASVDDLDACIEHGILEVDGSHLSFRHELARRAWLDGLSAVRLQRLHLEALQALESGDHGTTDSALLAHHAVGAADADAIATHVPGAARRAAALGAHREAARHYAAAVTAANRMNGGHRAELFAEYAYQCYLTDQLDAAIGAQTEALAIWHNAGDRRSEGNGLRFLSRLTWFVGRNADAIRHANAAIDVLQTFPDTPDLAMAYSNISQLHMVASESDDAVLWGEKAIAIAEVLHDNAVLAHALNNVGVALTEQHNPRGQAMLQRSLSISRCHQLHEHAARAYTNLASNFVRSREYDAGAEVLHRGIEFCIEEDLETWRIYMSVWLARERFERGRWDEAVDLATAVIEREGVAPVTLVGALVVIGRVRARRGDPEVWSVLDRALRVALGTGELQRLAPTVAARAEATWLAGDSGHVDDEVLSTLALARQRGEQWATGELALAVHRAGRSPGVVGCAEPFRLHIEGRLEAAAAAWDALGCPYEAADCRGDSDDPDVVAASLRELTALGAMARARQVADRLRSLGRPVPRGANSRTRTNVSGLTDREVEVALLLADGSTDKEIADQLVISRKTAGHHVSHVLTKLGARNRSEAAAIVARWAGPDATG